MSTMCLINSPSIRVWKRTGSEGPSFDPYHYEEYEIRKEGELTLTVHVGLAVWVHHEGIRTMLYPIGDEDGVSEPRINTFTIAACGYTISQIERFARKLRSRCRSCGRKDGLYEEGGYPGESMLVCHYCHHVNGSRFNEGAVI